MARPNLQDEVARWVRRAIFTGELKPGERINQDELAERLELSRLPIREAMIALEREGLIKTIPRRGSFVWDFRRQDILDQYEVYAMVSGLATERAAVNLSKDEVASLRGAVEEMASHKDPAQREAANDHFHAIINRASRSPRLMWLLGLLASSVPVGFHDTGWEIAVRDHRTIIEHLERGDAEAAAEAMRDHIRRTGTHAVDFLPLPDDADGDDPAELPAG
ncbi:GntR family transcriptional regulator [Streptomyces sp. RTd22]|uniref:GntR family transcriptional regulator n=1 Tax=Streptomyces sp. RTd22 TaxID=1841249 RepID=UPI0007C579E1|nr:GntR family transcriptional regulator [Streptomyces sp. RTd22]